MVPSKQLRRNEYLLKDLLKGSEELQKLVESNSEAERKLDSLLEKLSEDKNLQERYKRNLSRLSSFDVPPSARHHFEKLKDELFQYDELVGAAADARHGLERTELKLATAKQTVRERDHELEEASEKLKGVQAERETAEKRLTELHWLNQSLSQRLKISTLALDESEVERTNALSRANSAFSFLRSEPLSAPLFKELMGRLTITPLSPLAKAQHLFNICKVKSRRRLKCFATSSSKPPPRRRSRRY
jgi:DNA repair ATPase RecN